MESCPGLATLLWPNRATGRSNGGGQCLIPSHLGRHSRWATVKFVGVPGAIPYFGAIDLILRADLDTPAAVAALLFYNLVFVAPHAALISIRVLLPTHSERTFAAVASFCEVWGKRLVILILLVPGGTLTADAIGWWLGQPLLPVS